MNITPFDPTHVDAKVFRSSFTTIPAQYGDYTFTDVTFAYLGEFYGCRFFGIADIEHERRRFNDRMRKRRQE